MSTVMISVIEYCAYIAVILVVILIMIKSKQPRLAAFLKIQEQNEEIKKEMKEMKKEVEEVITNQHDNKIIMNKIHESNCRIEKFLEAKPKE